MATNKINFFRNKKGDKLLSIYWFAILMLVAGGVFAMVYIFYGSPYDVREIEANLMIDRIADCVSYAGKINSDFISDGSAKTVDDFLMQCHLSFESSDFTEPQFFSKTEFYKLENTNVPVASYSAGDVKWAVSCNLQEDKSQERLAKCVEKSFYSLDNLGNQYIIKILAVVRKSEKNVKI